MNQDYNNIIEERRKIRALERSLRRKESNKMNLKDQLASILPKNLMPSNVGHINEVTWPFFHTFNFDFGTDPIYGQSTKQTSSFQVTQEAGLLLMTIQRKSFDYSAAGEFAPLQVTIRDRQSSRQFNDNPIPLQTIGKKEDPTILPTPMLIQPNAFLDLEMSSWLKADAQSLGESKVSITVFGYRIRMGDMAKVYSTIFG